MKTLKAGRITVITALFTAVIIALGGCKIVIGGENTPVGGAEETDMRKQNKSDTKEPYAVTAALEEKAALDPETGIGVYGRYTVLTAAEDAPDSLKDAIAACNRRAEDAVMKRLAAVPNADTAPQAEGSGKYRFETYAYIATVTRADSAAFSILETEFEQGLPDSWSNGEISYRFAGTTVDTATGETVSLSDLVGDEASFAGTLSDTLKDKYGDSFAETASSDYAWTADALGIRFFFNADEDTIASRHAAGDYSDAAITAAFPYDALSGVKAEALSEAPEAYIAMLERETVYDLPHGDLSIQLTKDDEATWIRMIPDRGEESRLSIEYADDQSDFYIIRSQGGFYLFRERIGYQEGFFYDFSRPDGGFGRFAYNTSQYFDSFLREVDLALPYDPYCVHMAEVRRSFGESSYDAASFVPHGHYSFPDDPDARYKCFVLTDDSLRIDTRNTACRLLEDMTVTEIDADGNELREITAKAGEAIVLESVTGEADRYMIPTQRGRRDQSYTYEGRLTDGTRVRFISGTESVISVNAEYMNRYTTPVSLAEAQFTVTPGEAEIFTVRIGGKDYPVIPDYSKTGHVGEEIDFGGDIWWQAEGYVGRYIITDEDREAMSEEGFYFGPPQLYNETAELVITEDGEVTFECSGGLYRGTMPDKRYYGRDVSVAVRSETEFRSFEIILREGGRHSAPQKIEFYSEGLPATNEPSKVPPISFYLTKQ